MLGNKCADFVTKITRDSKICLWKRIFFSKQKLTALKSVQHQKALCEGKQQSKPHLKALLTEKCTETLFRINICSFSRERRSQYPIPQTTLPFLQASRENGIQMDYEMAVPHEVSGFHSFVTDIYIKQSDHTLKLQHCFLSSSWDCSSNEYVSSVIFFCHQK